MNINKINANYNQFFCATTKINAPKSMLNDDQIKFLTWLGSEVGTEADTFEFNVSDTHSNTRHPEVETYSMEIKTHQKTDTGIIDLESKKEIPYIKNGEKIENNSPFSYIHKFINRYRK